MKIYKVFFIVIFIGMFLMALYFGFEIRKINSKLAKTEESLVDLAEGMIRITDSVSSLMGIYIDKLK